MRWFKANLRSSIAAVFAAAPPAPPPEMAAEVSIEDIRTSMLALTPDSEDRQCVQLGRRIRYATDLLALWYLRGDLMAALAGHEGEALAREKVKGITRMFEGQLPLGLKSRPSPLSANRS